MSDRTVHALAAGGDEIVRYDRAGKWYLECPHPVPFCGAGRSWRKALTLTEAVALACNDGAARFYGKPGGQQFDARCRRAETVGGAS